MNLDSLFDDDGEETVEDILALLTDRRQKHSRSFYKPLGSARRVVIRQWYIEQLPPWLNLSGGDTRLFNKVGTPLANGYERIVVGDYGAYVEFTGRQLGSPLDGWNGQGNKYLWLRTRDGEQTKIYKQLQTVRYADYVPGMYYVAPSDVRT